MFKALMSKVVIFCSIAVTFSAWSLAGPRDSVKCHKANFQFISEICTDDLFGFIDKATFVKKDGSKCHLDLIYETPSVDTHGDGYYYSLATFAAKDGRGRRLHLRYEPSGYEQTSYNAVAVKEGNWLEQFDLVANAEVESTQCANLNEAGFYN